LPPRSSTAERRVTSRRALECAGHHSDHGTRGCSQGARRRAAHRTSVQGQDARRGLAHHGR
jgi:hypothetical protein